MKILILFLTILFLSCHENDRVPEYPPVEEDTVVSGIDTTVAVGKDTIHIK